MSSIALALRAAAGKSNNHSLLDVIEKSQKSIDTTKEVKKTKHAAKKEAVKHPAKHSGKKPSKVAVKPSKAETDGTLEKAMKPVMKHGFKKGQSIVVVGKATDAQAEQIQDEAVKELNKPKPKGNVTTQKVSLNIKKVPGNKPHPKKPQTAPKKTS